MPGCKLWGPEHRNMEPGHQCFCGYTHPAPVRESSSGRTPAFEAEDGGSNPPSRSIRKGFEVTLENGTALGWFEGREGGMVLLANGQAAAVLTLEEWDTFLEAAEHERDREPAPDDPTAHEAAIQRLIAQADGYARDLAQARQEAGEARVAAAEALQALEESTEVVARLTKLEDKYRRSFVTATLSLAKVTVQRDRLEAANHELQRERDQFEEEVRRLRQEAENLRLDRDDLRTRNEAQAETIRAYHRDGVPAVFRWSRT